jgi:hypothetical protein
VYCDHVLLIINTIHHGGAGSTWSEKTRVTVIFDAENENSEEMQRNGWQSILNNFKLYVEKSKF